MIRWDVQHQKCRAEISMIDRFRSELSMIWNEVVSGCCLLSGHCLEVKVGWRTSHIQKDKVSLSKHVTIKIHPTESPEKHLQEKEKTNQPFKDHIVLMSTFTLRIDIGQRCWRHHAKMIIITWLPATNKGWFRLKESQSLPEQMINTTLQYHFPMVYQVLEISVDSPMFYLPFSSV